MSDLKAVFTLVLRLLQTPVPCGSFSFTFLDFFIFLAVLSILLYFIKSVFSD